ncbi:hypothetical protein RF55_13145 [Lasius niger]|uniref:Uncharacterized protein n=1 Tax=Lasius niger TaxID=67767 RepID=A0A0J7KBA7_LASNI|nr:hypothetical protein RF55_13145 [Lasius niger]
MQKLESSMENEAYKKFTNNFFSIKRSDKYFCGTWSDMVIEQSLMKSSKSKEGFTRGRSTKESVLSKWIFGLLTASNISEGLESFCELSFDTGEQHVDARDSRVKKDDADVQKLSEWFQSHNPFPHIHQIMSIATGIIGDEKINCHNAHNIGTTAMEKKIGNNFNDIKFSRADRVLSLLTVNSNVKVRDTTVPIDPLLLFQRISVMKRSNKELRDYLQYELAPYPVSLFDELGMRKTKKSSFFDNFTPSQLQPDFENVTYVVDGGFLLHRVVWHQNETFDSICTTYVNYVQKHFGSNTIIVFDGYNNSNNSVKAMEQLVDPPNFHLLTFPLMRR